MMLTHGLDGTGKKNGYQQSYLATYYAAPYLLQVSLK